MKVGNRLLRRVIIGATLVIAGAVVAAGAVIINAREAQQARVQKLYGQFEAQHLKHFTLEEHAAIVRMQHRLLNPTAQELSVSERVEQLAKIVLRLKASSTTESVPTAAPFRGNTTALAFTHTGASGFALKRQADCSLSLLMANYSFGSTASMALSISAATSTSAQYEQTLHAAAGLTTMVGSTTTCPDPGAGLGAQRSVYLGASSSGALIEAGVGFAGGTGNSVFYGTVDPTGGTASTFQIDNSAPGVYEFATGDLNGDGQLDLIGVDQVNAQVVVWLTQPDGTLGTAVQYPVAAQGQGAVVADVNGDGKLDVVVATISNGTTDGLSILTGNGDGTLNAAQSLTVPAPPQGSSYHIHSVIAADLRGTGHPDLVLSNGWVYRNNGSGTFTQVTPQSFTPQLSASSFGPNLVAADFNKDGKLDLAVDTGPVIHIYTGNGDDTFAVGPAYASVSNVGYIAATDLDTDGNVDLWSGIVGGGVFLGDQYGVNEALALMGNGDGTFQGAPYLPFVYTGNNLADLTGDGVLDAVGVNANESMTSYIGTPKGAFTTGSAIALSPAPINGVRDTVSEIDGYAIADVNGDGKADLVVSVRGTMSTTQSQFLLLLGNGQGGFAAPTAIATPVFAPTGQTDTNLTFADVRLVDVNGDGKPDLVYFYTDQYGGTYIAGTAVQLGNGDGTFQAPVSIPYYSQTTSSTQTSEVIATADLNGDGKPDLILLTDQTTLNYTFGGYDAEIQVALGHGDGTFATPVTITGPTEIAGIQLGTNGYAPIVVADMNGDGKPDIVAIGSDSNDNAQVAVMLGNGDGSFKAPVLQSYDGEYLNGIGLAVADFNADGKLDVFISNPFSLLGTGIAFGNGDGTLQFTGSQSEGEIYVNEDVALALSGAVASYSLSGVTGPVVLVGSIVLLNQATTSGSGGTGTTPDFSVAAAPVSQTVAPGAAATTTITVTPTGGFAAAVALSCTGLPSGATCGFAPTTVTPSGAAVTSTLTISTAAATTSNATQGGLLFGSSGALLAVFALPVFVGYSRRYARRAASVAGAVACLLILVSCGGGSGSQATSAGSGSSTGTSGTPGTPAGTSTVTISAVSGTTTHTTTFSLTVS